MTHRNLTVLRATVIAAAASIASAGLAAPPAPQNPGSYALSFHHYVFGELEPASSLPVCTQSACESLVLKAYVEDSAGAPATSGLITFQYCSLKGLPSNDISRPDEAPKAACGTRSAAWSNLATFRVADSGDAYYNFGIVIIPRTVGFRFLYTRGSDIPKGASAAADFVWTPAE